MNNPYDNYQIISSNYTRTEKLIGEIFCQLYLKMPIEKISVTLICQKANISRTTFYFYYSSIYDILSYCENGFIDYISLIFKKLSSFANTEDYSELIQCFQQCKYFAKIHLSGNQHDTFLEKWKKNIKYQYYEITQGNEFKLEILSTLFITTICYWITNDINLTTNNITSLRDLTLYIIRHKGL